MSAADWIDYWSDSLLATAVLVMAVLLVRKPFARHFGPQLAYALWLVPGLRLVMPPLPYIAPAAPQVAQSVAPLPATDAVPIVALEASAVPAASPSLLTDLTPLFLSAWTAGALVVLVSAILSYRRFRHGVLEGAVALESIGSTRLVMSETIDGPVAFGLWRRYVAVPQDFFARYDSDERALAIDHEMSHHRHGDLWANAGALLLLSAQWFNPFAWVAVRAFRFDQEAACDARVLGMSDVVERPARTAYYAATIAKAAVGPRLALAAPMATHDNLQERLKMLLRDDVSKGRGRIGRVLLGGAAFIGLAATATLVPIELASAADQASEMPAPPAPPAPPEFAGEEPPAPPAPPEPAEAPRVIIFTTKEKTVTDGDAKGEEKPRKEVRRVEIHRDGTDKDGVRTMVFAPKDGEKFRFSFPGSLSRADILATLKEKGISDKKAEAIADKLEAKRMDHISAMIPPVPPIPPVPLPPELAQWEGKAMAFEFKKCRDGKRPVSYVNRDENKDGSRSHIVMQGCDRGESESQIAALKRARDSFASAEHNRAMSAEIRAKVVADLEKAIADMEKGLK